MFTLAYALTAFVITSGATYWIADRLAQRNQRLRERLTRIDTSRHADALGPRAASAGPSENAGTAARRPDLLPTLTQFLRGNTWDKPLRLAMVRAGLRLRPAEFVALCAVSMAGLSLAGLALAGQWPIALILSAVGLGLPLAIVKHRQEARRRRFDAQLTDSLTLIASSLRSGYSFLRAMQLVAEEMPTPIAEEFAWALGEATLGVPTETALERMVERVRSYDLDLVVTAVAIQLQVGGNLADILDTISATIRERVRMQGEISALTAEGKLSGVVLFLLPPAIALLIRLRSPEYFTPLLETRTGVAMIVGALAGQGVGGLVLRRMVALDI